MFHIRRLYNYYQQPNGDMEVYSTPELVNLTSAQPQQQAHGSSYTSKLNYNSSSNSAAASSGNGKKVNSSGNSSYTSLLFGGGGASVSGGGVTPQNASRPTMGRSLLSSSSSSSGSFLNSSPLVNANCKIAVSGSHVAMGVKNGLLLINLPMELDKRNMLSIHHLTNDSKFETSQVQFNPKRGDLIASSMTNVIQVWDVERLSVVSQQDYGTSSSTSNPILHQKRSQSSASLASTVSRDAPATPSSTISSSSRSSSSTMKTANQSLKQQHSFETHPSKEYLSFSISQAHDRAITDIGWCPSDSNILASCSADTCIRFWDIRTPANDIKTYCAYTGASILRWHPSEYKVATAHDGEVRIWDMRKQSAYKPVQFLTAHTERVTSLDWSPLRPHEILTTAQDRLIKLWNVNAPEEPVVSSSVQYPVRMARYTPFGDGIVTVAKTQDLAIRLWKPDRDLSKLNHVHAFLGHAADIKSFDFRIIPSSDAHFDGGGISSVHQRPFSSGSDTAFSPEEEPSPQSPFHDGMDYQIVSWSKDWKIKVWQCDADIRRSLATAEEPLSPGSNLSQQEYTRSPSQQHTQRSRLSSNEYISFEDECNEIPKIFSHDQIQLLNLNEDEKECLVEVHFPADCRDPFLLHIEYPVGYPTYTQPKFTLKNLTPHHSPKLVKSLNKIMDQTAESSLVMHDFCTIKVLKKVLSHLQKLPRPIQTTNNLQNPSLSSSSDISSTPAPRTSQAIFSPTGHLIYFNNFSKRTNVTVRKRMAARKKIPRTYEQFKNVLSKSRTRSEKITKHNQVSYIFEHVFTSEMNDELSSGTQSSSTQSKSGARSAASPPLQQAYPSSIDSLIHVYDVRALFPISYTLASELKVDGASVQEICLHNHDVCLNAGMNSAASLWMIVSHIADSFLCSDTQTPVPWALHPCGRDTVKSIMDHLFKKRDIQAIAIISCVLSLPQRPRDVGSSSKNYDLIDPEDLKLYNTVRMYYSEILHRWGLDCQRNELLKFVHTTQSKEQALESKSFVNVARVKCSICHVPTNGLCMVCVNCGHGGHFNHMVSWFEKVDLCATGCGCVCAEYMSSVLAPYSEHMAPTKQLPTSQFNRKIFSSRQGGISTSSASNTQPAATPPSWPKIFFGRFGPPSRTTD